MKDYLESEIQGLKHELSRIYSSDIEDMAEEIGCEENLDKNDPETYFDMVSDREFEDWEGIAYFYGLITGLQRALNQYVKQPSYSLTKEQVNMIEGLVSMEIETLDKDGDEKNLIPEYQSILAQLGCYKKE